MSALGRVVLVETADLEEYPIARGVRLDGHSFVKWQHLRWMSSTTYRRASWEVIGMAQALFDMAQLESPVGTLPDDNEELAQMLRVDLRRMRDLRGLEFGPLRNWRPCLSEGQRRLMHPVVLEQVQDALDRREERVQKTGAKADYQRLKRLREAMAALGLGRDALGDEVLIRRMDEWLTAQKPRRDRAAYDAVIVEAVKVGWVGGAVARAGGRAGRD